MFFLAGLFLIWALVTFGAVLPQTSLLLMRVWFAVAALAGCRQILRRGRLDYLVIAMLTAGGLAVIFLGPKLALWVLALLWMWKAGRDHPENVIRYLRFLVVVGVLEASLGLIQYFVAPGWIFGYQNPYSTVSGTLINRNHFAGLIEMFVPCCIGLGFMSVRRYGDVSRSYLYVLAGAFMALSLVFSLSRMGIFSFFATMVLICILLLLRQSERRMAAGLGLGLVGLLIAGALWIGIDAIVARYADLVQSNTVVDQGRKVIFTDTLRLIRAYPGGVGIGKYQDLFRRFQTFHPELLVDHAHNDYLETAAEWGIGVALVFWVIVIAIFVSMARRLLLTQSDERGGILLACTGSVFTLLVHGLADFNLQIPSNAMLFFSFLGIGLAVLLPKHDLHNGSH